MFGLPPFDYKDKLMVIIETQKNHLEHSLVDRNFLSSVLSSFEFVSFPFIDCNISLYIIKEILGICLILKGAYLALGFL